MGSHCHFRNFIVARKILYYLWLVSVAVLGGPVVVVRLSGFNFGGLCASTGFLLRSSCSIGVVGLLLVPAQPLCTRPRRLSRYRKGFVGSLSFLLAELFPRAGASGSIQKPCVVFVFRRSCLPEDGAFYSDGLGSLWENSLFLLTSIQLFSSVGGGAPLLREASPFLFGAVPFLSDGLAFYL